MNETTQKLDGVALALLEAQLMTGDIKRPAFVEQAARLGLSAAAAFAAADKVIAIAANQTARRTALRTNYDYIIIGSGAAGSVVARRLAENSDIHVLLLEAGASDLKPSILIPEAWYINLGTEFDWKFAIEPSATANNRRLQQNMGKALGGGTTINAMVWARGHKNDFDHWAREAGDDAWGYAPVLDIYRRIEDWHGAPDPLRRGQGGDVFVQAVPDPSPIA